MFKEILEVNRMIDGNRSPDQHFCLICTCERMQGSLYQWYAQKKISEGIVRTTNTASPRNLC